VAAEVLLMNMPFVALARRRIGVRPASSGLRPRRHELRHGYGSLYFRKWLGSDSSVPQPGQSAMFAGDGCSRNGYILTGTIRYLGTLRRELGERLRRISKKTVLGLRPRIGEFLDCMPRILGIGGYSIIGFTRPTFETEFCHRSPSRGDHGRDTPNQRHRLWRRALRGSMGLELLRRFPGSTMLLRRITTISLPRAAATAAVPARRLRRVPGVMTGGSGGASVRLVAPPGQVA